MVSMSRRRPRAGGDPHAVPPRWGTVSDIFCNHKGRRLWVPAFAGTTRGAILRVHHMSRRLTRISSSPRKRGSSIPERLSMNRDAAAYCIACSTRSLTPEEVGLVSLSTRRPRAGGDPYAVPLRWGTVSDIFCNNKGRWLWVPAFAGTTRGELMQPSSPSLPRRADLDLVASLKRGLGPSDARRHVVVKGDR